MVSLGSGGIIFICKKKSLQTISFDKFLRVNVSLNSAYCCPYCFLSIEIVYTEYFGYYLLYIILNRVEM